MQPEHERDWYYTATETRSSVNSRQNRAGMPTQQGEPRSV